MQFFAVLQVSPPFPSWLASSIVCFGVFFSVFFFYFPIYFLLFCCFWPPFDLLLLQYWAVLGLKAKLYKNKKKQTKNKIKKI